MKKFDYPEIEVNVVDAIPENADAGIEWRSCSQHPFIEEQLGGEQTIKTLLPSGLYWTYARVSEQNTPFETLTQARKLCQNACRKEDQHLVLVADDDSLLDALLSAALAAHYQLPNFKKTAECAKALKISVFGQLSSSQITQRLAEAEGNAFVRYLTTLPANELNPWSYREMVEELADSENWECRVYRYKELEQMGAGAFLAVARGSQHKDASIVRIHYKGDPDSVDTVALVGKGVTFDTGGYNLKVAGSMYGMNNDMNGSAIVLGNMLAASRRQEKINLSGWLALTENHLGPEAYHANQWVRALNGTTIEVVDTDAEGRMVLADTLTLASREHPKAVIDFATLTGSCVAALSTRYSGVFTNHEPWFLPLIECGKLSGERIWPFPIDEDYDDNIKSDVADIQQCNPGKSSDHIDAARFLSRFVEPNVRWVHVDVAAAKHNGGLAHVPTDITGFGVRLTSHLLKMLF